MFLVPLNGWYANRTLVGYPKIDNPLPLAVHPVVRKKSRKSKREIRGQGSGPGRGLGLNLFSPLGAQDFHLRP